MKKIYVLTLAIFCFYQLNAQMIPGKNKYTKELDNIEINNASKLSTSCKLFILRLKDKNYIAGTELDKKFIEDNLIATYNGLYYIGGLLKVDTDLIDIESLKSYGVKVNSIINNIWTVKVPIDKLENFTNLKGVIFFEKSKKVRRLMDDAKTQTNVDDVHLGTGLSSSYKGDDVVVGIIDGGFDYTHPAFEDANGDLRIKRVWEQLITSQSYPSPSGFNYGMELINSADILAMQHDAVQDNSGNWVANGSHGSHVASIAAGSDNPVNGIYGGCAPNADLVFTSMASIDNIVDGISYIFDYAASVNKPAVINMSLGVAAGPHDGTSLLDQAYTSLVSGTGKVLVGAAGNEGSDMQHFGHSFSGVDSIYASVSLDPTNASPNDDQVTIEAWGEPNTDFCFAVIIYDPSLSTNSALPSWICASTDATSSGQLTGSDGGVANIEWSCEASSSLNSKPHIEYTIQVTTNDYVVIGLGAQTNTVNMWITNPGYGMVKWTQWGGAISQYLTPGDNNMSVGEIGGTGTHVISVGAYTSKDQWTDTQGSNHQIPQLSSIGDIAPFSSLGPTADGRTKPDITAPGNILAAAVSSFDPANQQGGGSYDRVVANVGSNNWPYGVKEGTSMATPMVTGIVALLFDINPNLSFSDIKNLIQSTAITDNYTGNVPNNTWGAGKIDALGAASGTTPTSVNQYTSNDIFIYPNPSNDKINVYIPEYIKSNQINIIDCLGKRVYSTNYASKKTIDVHNFSKGIYFLEVGDEINNYREKLIIN